MIMNEQEKLNLEVVRKYFDGCNSGDIEVLLSTLTEDVRHYFLPPSFPPIFNSSHLANYWHKYKLVLNPVWAIDRLIASGDEVVNEWSCLWTPPDTSSRVMTRGTEWYVMRDGRIAEVRAYFIADSEANSELSSFPYKARGYLLDTDA